MEYNESRVYQMPLYYRQLCERSQRFDSRSRSATEANATIVSGSSVMLTLIARRNVPHYVRVDSVHDSVPKEFRSHVLLWRVPRLLLVKLRMATSSSRLFDRSGIIETRRLASEPRSQLLGRRDLPSAYASGLQIIAVQSIYKEGARWECTAT